jgi:hypothetical protein
VRGRVRTRGERLVERWISRESRLVEILVDNTQTHKQALKQTGLAANLSDRQTYRQVSRQTDRTNMQPRPGEDGQTAIHRQDKAERRDKRNRMDRQVRTGQV